VAREGSDANLVSLPTGTRSPRPPIAGPDPGYGLLGWFSAEERVPYPDDK
jgi:hypothetical protein